MLRANEGVMKISFILYFLVLAGLLLPVGALASSPRYVRLSYPEADAATAIGIAWTTNSAGDPTVVQYGFDDTYGSEAQGTAFSGSGDLQAIHEVTLTGLEPDTAYHYRVGGPGTWSDDFAFVTAPEDGCSPYTFIALGDDRSDNDYGPNPRWNGIIMEAMETFPLFVLNSGDLVKDGGESQQWDHWLEETDPALAFAAHMPTIGNHDDGPGEGDGAHYNQIFHLPRNTVTGTEDYYYFTTGNAIMVSLSTQSFKGGSIPFADQAAWLDQVLTENPRMWRFVFFHHPTYCSEDWFGLVHEPNEQKQNAALTPLFDKHHVDIVFYGHNHWYERLGPLQSQGGEPEGKEVGSYEDGTVYVVTGGAGAMAFNVIVNLFCPSTAGSKVCSGDHHFVKIDLDYNKLTYTAQATKTQLIGTSDANSKVIETFTIEKPVTGPNPCTPIPPVDPGPESVSEVVAEPMPDVAEDVMITDASKETGPGETGPGDTAATQDTPVVNPEVQDATAQSDAGDLPPKTDGSMFIDVPGEGGSKSGGSCSVAGRSTGFGPFVPFLVAGLLFWGLRRRKAQASLRTPNRFS